MSFPADIALHMLSEGNDRFVAGESRVRFTAGSRAASVAGQRPWAVVVGCSDSRVPVEAIFDVGAGELFVVRTAGHVISESGLASVRFAAEKLGTELVVVLGHEDCGAVAAALEPDAPEWLAPVLDHITPPVFGADAPTGALERLAIAVDAHVRESVVELRSWLDEQQLPGGTPRVVGAAYELASGHVHWL